MSTVLDAMNIPRLVEGLVRKYGSINAAARACGMPEGTMHRLANGDRNNPTWETLQALARGYDKPVSEIAAMLERKKGVRAPLS
jgi:transcriptional regulator with XRE-family HTH domain